ncbi:putative MFS family arabinose efflux permease [Aliiruegeria haliotis]|uniref:Putative MFS family arabinose efflux permease n=1 Tax=Aliiruegeria haliotis TaxID=1280846 RepID=A0A2T0RR57_9RHOB|nr:MFS transporter [Aliiruegeria haliotis]PRY23607.1 putative MFS family arabinose efflux permease [Aliiruegeria haliotis]
MGRLLTNRTYRHLFGAQIVALIGTGLATVALGLLAFELAGDKAGLVVGTALTLKMVAYVFLSPMAGALADRVSRRRLLVALDAVRACVALMLPFVTEIWQIYVLIFLLQSASAAFTPTFQATIPDVLPDEEDYTRALSLSRLAYDLESLLSPMLAAALLAAMSFDALFLGTGIGFVASGLLVVSVALPNPKPSRKRRFVDQATRGIRIYLNTPRLQGLLALNACAASVISMVLVNTVVLVRGDLGLGENAVALTLGAFGAGSMAVALVLPRALSQIADRRVMVSGATALVATLAALAAVVAVAGLTWGALLLGWAVLGAGYSAVMTPSGRLLKRSAHPEDRPSVFAAQFALSHACWLVAYPLAGSLQTYAGTMPTMICLDILAMLGLLTSLRLWRANQPREFEHRHDDLPDDHPHLQDHGTGAHRHTFVIDDVHRHWPGAG